MGRGTWSRDDARRTVENALALDIRELHVDELGLGRRVVVKWSGGWGRSAVAVERVDADSLWITYSLGQRPQPVLQRVALERTGCHYGGSRPWWSCPECDRRCALLYLIGERFTCRVCAGLTYTTSQSSRWIRSARKTNDLARRIGKELYVPYAVKPPGMHWRTFERLVAEYVAASGATSVAMQPFLERAESASRRGLAAALAGPVVPPSSASRWAEAVADELTRS